MRRVVFAVAVVGAAFALGFVTAPGRASLYSPDEPFSFPVGDDRKAKPLPFDRFKEHLVGLTTARDERKINGKANDDRQKLLDRIGRREGLKLSAEETAALVADLIRVGRLNEALDRIKLRVGDRKNPSYFAFTTLAHVHAARGEWQEAADYQEAALIDTEMPAQVKGLTQPQRDWVKHLDQDYVLPYFRFRLQESAAVPRPNPADEDLPPLFPIAQRGEPREPVRFVNAEGKYEPGKLAPAERAKLPPDAIAIVQQLMLWFPTDARLYWLLAELYAADGQVHVAKDILDNCVSEARQYGNRRILAEHRTAVWAAAAATPRPREDIPLVQPDTQPTQPQAEQPPPEQPPITMKTILLYFGVVAAIGGLAIFRTLRRRLR